MERAYEVPAAGGPVSVTTPGRDALLAEVHERLREGRGFALATINLDHAVKLRRDPAFAEAYRAHDLIVADGNPIVWLSRLAKRPVGLVQGSDLVRPLAGLAAEARERVALVGATDAVLEAAERTLCRDVEGLEIGARIAPSQGFDPAGPEAAEIIETLGRSGARLVFLALGAPRQERFAARAAAALPGVGFASVGAGLDFLAGTQTRAPVWVRRIAMEWLWRMLSNPKRLARRYAECALILPGLARHAMAQRGR